MSRALEVLARWWWGQPLWELAALEERPSDFSVAADGSVDAMDLEWVALCAAADLFLRAGGVVSCGWWARLTPLERLALVDAGDRAWAARAVAIGTAVSDPAAVASRFDGGRLSVRSVVVRESRAAANEARGKEVT